MSFSYRIDDEIFRDHPDYCRGVVVFSHLDNRAGPSALEPLLRAAERHVRQAVQGNVAEHPHIAAWREAYRRFGAKPSEHRSSIEAMSRRVLKPAELPSINPMVDIGNVLSLRHLLPAGMHPITAGHRDLALRRAKPEDRFTPADGAPVEIPDPREVVLASGNEVLTRRWTWRQAAGTQMLPATPLAFLNVDGLAPVGEDTVQAAMDEAIALAEAHCGAKVVCRHLLAADRASFRTDLDL